MLIKNNAILLKAWKKLLLAYVGATLLSLLVGYGLIHIFSLEPENIHAISSKRISYAFPVLAFGVSMGIDLGLLLFVWKEQALPKNITSNPLLPLHILAH